MVSKKEVKKIPIAESTIDDNLKKVEKEITSNVVSLLSPEINNAIQKKFDEMKTIFTNEVQDLRKHFESQVPNTVLNTVPSTIPINSDSSTQTQEKAGLETLLPLIQMLGIGSNQNGSTNMTNMFMEALLRKSLADITRSDMMNEIMTKTMYKRLSGETMPDMISDTTDSLMNPLRKYGETTRKTS